LLGLPGASLAQRPAVPPGDREKFRSVFGSDRGLGVGVVNGCSDCRGCLSPNGPPSHRLAPGGFY